MTNSYVAKLLKAVAKSNRGATAVEYGLIAALIAAAIAAAVGSLGSNLDTKLDSVCSSVKGGAC